MKSIQKPNVLGSAKKRRLSENHKAKFFIPPLNDSQIIEIQDLFMTPSIHQLTTKNISTGRELLENFVYSLKHYQKIALLSTVDFVWKKETVNLYKLVQKSNHISIAMSLEKLCTEITFIDFVWIELTQKLCAQLSENQLQNICQNLSSQNQVPVILMSYP